MQTRHIKLPAFTIMETILVMVVTAILIGFSYSAYLLISRSYQSFNTKNKHMMTVLQLDKLLKKDFIQARLITLEDRHLIFHGDSMVTDYEFQPDYILRTRGLTDTFYVQSTAPVTAFEELRSDSTQTGSDNTVDDLQLTVFLQKQKIPYHYHKLYSSENLFQPSTDAIH
ncbi:hypothetical protein [Mucilaginibacter sp. 22184]|uniref:hypothetical protein n=1 Tax=Mucilaginibacter sp. 22184 TaxID=3453887 RepID=UPI003F8357CB